MSSSELLRKHLLECLRLAADCEQAARDIDDPVMRAYYARMADVWAALAEREPAGHPKMMKLP